MIEVSKAQHEMSTCVRRNCQMPHLCRGYFHRRRPTSMSTRSARSDASVEKTPILLCSVRRTTQVSVSWSQTATDVTAPNREHSQEELWKLKGRTDNRCRRQYWRARRPRQARWRSCYDSRAQPWVVSRLDTRCKRNGFLLTHAGRSMLMQRRTKDIQTSAW
jgi:hypothetical protein